MSDDIYGPIFSHRDTWVCPLCSEVHYLHVAGNASDQMCPCEEEEPEYADDEEGDDEL